MALIHIGGKSYELIHENRNGWNPEAFRNRYSDVLERYDYVLGDWGYNQLRLKGFFRDNYQKAAKDSVYSTISDYINEYCNFGCAYFVLEKQQGGRMASGEGDIELETVASPIRQDGYGHRAPEPVVAISAAKQDNGGQPSKPAASGQPHGSKGQRQEGGNQSQGNSEGRRKDGAYRKGNRGGEGYRGKKPSRPAAPEQASGAEQQPRRDRAKADVAPKG